ncbi:hypothetical protein GCM10009641_32690 [Mycobacterium cookii]|uniref:PknH-like extracellular domain-containing protein n=1 Tax=Nocardioides furvisabuli TaxID=375542 RepID=A0ABP5JAB0_9ACTN|nr:hypothetical protein [Nocardioides furvisabuli]
MRFRAPLVTGAVACLLTLGGCGDRGPVDASMTGGVDSAADASAREASVKTGTAIPDDFALSAGMGGPSDIVATSRSGTGLRDLSLCGTEPLRGLGLRDRMVADDSGGESADTRELVLLGTPEQAQEVARSFTDLPAECDPRDGGDAGVETLTEVRESPFGAAPATTLVQNYAFDGASGGGATVLHVVPVGAALLVTSTYGRWPSDEGVASTVEPLRATVDAMVIFEDGATPSAGPETSTRVGSARLLVATYGEGSLASLDEQADGVTGTTEEILPAMCVFTRTGC